MQMRTEPVGQGDRDFDPQLAVGVDPDRFITAGLAGFTVRGQKHSGRIPLDPPLLLSHLGDVKVLADAPQTFTTHGDRRAPRRQCLLGGSQPLV